MRHLLAGDVQALTRSGIALKKSVVRNFLSLAKKNEIAGRTQPLKKQDCLAREIRQTFCKAHVVFEGQFTTAYHEGVPTVLL